ncbi:hypothetical protein BGZ63DRAFT_418066 [Mariannaea sp. PMI_226]|nr:hypothetical protein BGZ63DRAFT_418066 [Mariannaea sp. PMI_226]
MGIDARGGISIAELIVYIPAIVLSIIVCSRHGFKRSSGWLYTLLLCFVRIIGAICQLITYSNKSEGLIRATLIIDSIGLSPLLLATLGMISRLVDWINVRNHPIFTIKHFRLTQLLITLSLILSIVGGTSGSTSSNGTVKPATTSKVAIILFILSFVAMMGMLIVSFGYLSSVPAKERRIVMAVGVAAPFISVRLLYSVLAVFLSNKTFSVVGGSVAVRAAMAVVEEFIVVLDYLIVGYTLDRLDEHQQGELASRSWKAQRNRNRHNQNHSPKTHYNGASTAAYGEVPTENQALSSASNRA